jgi:hypothetical protein
MNIFEPLFLLLVLTTVVTLGTAGVCLIRGAFGRAGRILRRLAVGAAAYFAIVIVVSLVSPQRVFQIGDTRCFDDWCIAVVGAQWASPAAGSRYEVTLRLSNRARRRPMGEKGTVVYLTDAKGRRYDPLRDGADVTFDTVLQPGQSTMATRRFDVPRGTPGLDLVYVHEGGFPIGWLIITEGGWFQKPAVVRLSPPS